MPKRLFENCFLYCVMTFETFVEINQLCLKLCIIYNYVTYL